MDAREKLVQVGNQLLDKIYDWHKYMETMAEVEAIMKLPDGEVQDRAAQEYIEKRGPATLSEIITGLQLQREHSELTKEYVTTRSTIESLEASLKTEMPRVD